MSTDLDSRLAEWQRNVRGREVTNEDTLESYTRWIRRFESWNTHGQPSEVTLREFDSYLAEQHEFPWNMTRPIDNEEDRPGYAYRTRVKALSAAKLWLRVEYGVNVDNEVQNIALGEAPDFDPDWLSRNDIENIIADAGETCDVPGCEAALRLGYDAIMRCAELCEVTREDLDLDRGTIFVHAKKGSMDAEIGISERTAAALRDHVQRHPDRDHLFYNSYGRPWKKKPLAKHYHRSHHPTGIHSFTRHSPIIHRLNDGEPLGEVSRRARHRNISTTKQYARLVGAEIPDWAED